MQEKLIVTTTTFNATRHYKRVQADDGLHTSAAVNLSLELARTNTLADVRTSLPIVSLLLQLQHIITTTSAINELG